MNVPDECKTLANHILEKNDWSKDTVDDVKTVAKEDLKVTVAEIQKRISELKGEYGSMVEADKISANETKTALNNFIVKVSGEASDEITTFFEKVINAFALNIELDIQYIVRVQTKAEEATPAAIEEHVKTLRTLIETECTSNVRSLQTQEVTAEQTIQNELVENSISVPNYIFAFTPTEVPSISDRLNATDAELFKQNKIAEVGPVLVKLAGDDLVSIAQDVDAQVTNAHGAILVNIQDSTKLTQQEKDRRVEILSKLQVSHTEAIKRATDKVNTFIKDFTAAIANANNNGATFLDDIADETQNFADELNNIGERFFADLSSITGAM